MLRITTTIIAAALFASVPLLGVAAQQPPPPEGAPIQGNVTMKVWRKYFPLFVHHFCKESLFADRGEVPDLAS